MVPAERSEPRWRATQSESPLQHRWPVASGYDRGPGAGRPALDPGTARTGIPDAPRMGTGGRVTARGVRRLPAAADSRVAGRGVSVAADCVRQRGRTVAGAGAHSPEGARRPCRARIDAHADPAAVAD